MPDRSRHLTARSSPAALPRRRRVRSPPTPSPPPPLGETNYYRSKKRSRTRSVTLNQPALGLGPAVHDDRLLGTSPGVEPRVGARLGVTELHADRRRARR